MKEEILAQGLELGNISILYHYLRLYTGLDLRLCYIVKWPKCCLSLF